MDDLFGLAQVRVGHQNAETPCKREQILDGGRRNQAHELLTAPPAKNVRRAGVGLERLRDEPQNVVSTLVPVAVVDVLEMVDVDKEHPEIPVVAAKLIEFFADAHFHVCPIKEPCKPIHVHLALSSSRL
jgi:hypothetical protein